MITLLICLAVALLAAGVSIATGPPARREEDHQITIKNDRSVVTVRSAGSGSITVTFDPSELPAGKPVELGPGEDSPAEKEVTLFEEFTDPATTKERKRKIAALLSESGYTVRLREDSNPLTAPADGQDAGISDSLPDGEGCDEGTVNPYDDPDQD